MNIFEFLQLDKTLINDTDIDQEYSTFFILKHDGKSKRRIDAPSKLLKTWQRIILDNLLYKFTTNTIAHGFVKERSPRTNAYVHIQKKLIIKTDIQDFFPSLTYEKVATTLRRLIGQLKDVKYADSDIDLLTKVLCLKGVLPQGAPTSPAMANLICADFDIELNNLGQEFNCEITRYADDITVSMGDNSHVKQLVNAIYALMKKYDLKPNYKKLKIFSNATRQEVTGVVVNEKLNAPKSLWRPIRVRLHQLQGKELDAESARRLRGQIEWIRSLNPNRGNRFLQDFKNIIIKDQI